MFEFDHPARAEIVSIEPTNVIPSYAAIVPAKFVVSDYAKIPLEVMIPKERDEGFRRFLHDEGINITLKRTVWVTHVDQSREISASCKDVLAVFGFSTSITKKTFGPGEIKAAVESVSSSFNYFGTYRNLTEADATTVFTAEIAKLCPMQISEASTTSKESNQTAQSDANQKPENGQASDKNAVAKDHQDIKLTVSVDWKRVSKKSFTGLARLKDELQADSFTVLVREKPLRRVEGATEANREEWQDIGELVAGVNYFLSAKGDWTGDEASGPVKECGKKAAAGTNFAFPDKPKFSLILQFVRYDDKPPEILPDCIADVPMFMPHSNGMLRGRINGEAGKSASYKGRIFVSATPKTSS